MTLAVERTRLWRLANPGRRAETDRKRRASNLDKERQREAAYRESHRDEIRKRQRRWALEHPESNAAAVQKYRASGRTRENARRWRTAHPTQNLARVQRYRAANPDFMRVATERRRARKAAVPHTLTVAAWHNILEVYDHRCAYCGADGRMTQDHVIPLILGGGTTPENIVPACQPCNSRKSVAIWEPRRP